MNDWTRPEETPGCTGPGPARRGRGLQYCTVEQRQGKNDAYRSDDEEEEKSKRQSCTTLNAHGPWLWWQASSHGNSSQLLLGLALPSRTRLRRRIWRHQHQGSAPQGLHRLPVTGELSSHRLRASPRAPGRRSRGIGHEIAALLRQFRYVSARRAC